MKDYLVNHAIRNVWCTPDQDSQVIFRPARLTVRRGVQRQVDVEWQRLALPDNVSTFHVFQIGQIHPNSLGLATPTKGKWITLAELCNQGRTISDVYLINGIQFPRFATWVQFMGDRNLIIAVQDQPLIASLRDQDLYVRLYTNAFYNSPRSDQTGRDVLVQGFKVEKAEQVLLLQRRIRQYRSAGQTVNCFRNGRLVNDLPPDRYAIGDLVEIVVDPSIHTELEFTVANLDTFKSLLDSKIKYLLHDQTYRSATINYRDDIDIWLVKPEGRHYTGVFYHRNQEDAVRMVTHQDWSIPVSYLSAYVQNPALWQDLSEMVVRVQIRHSGYERPLIMEHHRIHELYKLDEPLLSRAMLGLDSNVSVWRADALEQSLYTQIMRTADSADITGEFVEQAYGYNGIAKLLADTPTLTEVYQGQNSVVLPPGLREQSTVFEYDSNGYLLGFYSHQGGNERYITRDPKCTMVEAFVGIGGETLSTVYGGEVVDIDPLESHRYYVCDIVEGEPDYRWRDVTDTDVYTTVGDSQIVWHLDTETYYTAVRNDRHFLAYTYQVTADQGTLRFSIAARENRGSSAGNMLPTTIPMGRLDLWLNGRPLIEGLDFFVRWPSVVICNKEYLIEGDQLVTVRATSFCQPDMTRETIPEVGFVQYGQLSYNNRFDIRDDRVLHIVVDGAVYHRDELGFAENDSITVAGVRNGAPYLIRDVIVPMRGLAVSDTYDLRQRSLVIDSEVSDYMSLHHPQTTHDDPSIIPELYQVFSPFLSKIHYDLQAGNLAPEGIDDQYSIEDIRGWVADYEYLLPYDPLRNDVDRRYVAVHPTNLYTVSTLNVYQYTFFTRVAEAYFGDKVDITPFVKIKEGWI